MRFVDWRKARPEIKPYEFVNDTPTRIIYAAAYMNDRLYSCEVVPTFSPVAIFLAACARSERMEFTGWALGRHLTVLVRQTTTGGPKFRLSR